MMIDRIHQIGQKQENKTNVILMMLLLLEELMLLHKKYFRGTDYEISSQFHPKTLAKCKVLKLTMIQKC